LDNTYHRLYAEPTYDTVEDEVRQNLIREADEIFEIATPPLPDREQEIEYMQW
jgi:hypothetical protein